MVVPDITEKGMEGDAVVQGVLEFRFKLVKINSHGFEAVTGRDAGLVHLKVEIVR